MTWYDFSVLDDDELRGAMLMGYQMQRAVVGATNLALAEITRRDDEKRSGRQKSCDAGADGSSDGSRRRVAGGWFQVVGARAGSLWRGGLCAWSGLAGGGS